MGNLLPKKWVLVELEKLGENKYYAIGDGDHGQIKPSHYQDDGIPYIRVSDMGWGNFKPEKLVYISEEVHNKNLKSELLPGDILIAKTGATIGKCCIVPNYISKANTTSSVGKVSVNNDLVSNKWILYYFLSPDFYRLMWSKSNRTAQPGFNIIHLKQFLIPLPPLAEQQRIVAKLDALFAQHGAMKKALERIPELLRDFRQQLLTKAFTGELTEQWRAGKLLNEIPLKKVDKVLQVENLVLNGENLTAGRSKIKINPINFIRKNHVNWNYYTIESLSVAIVDCLHETAVFSNTGYKIIDTNNIVPFGINQSKLRYVDEETYKKWISRLKPRYGDIVFTREGSIGNVVMVPENEKYCIGQRTMIFRFTELLNNKFCEFYLNSELFKIQYKPLIKGVASQHVNIRDLRILEIPLPSIEEQKEIVTRLENLSEKADIIEKRYKTLKEKIDSLPQAILHKAFKGELVPQLPTDGDAKDLLKEILKLKSEVKKK